MERIFHVPRHCERRGEGGGGRLSISGKPTGTATVIPKASEKCSLTFHGIYVYSAEPHRPKGFCFPTVEDFWDFFPTRPSPAYMASWIHPTVFSPCSSLFCGDIFLGSRLVTGATTRLRYLLGGHAPSLYASLLSAPSSRLLLLAL